MPEWFWGTLCTRDWKTLTCNVVLICCYAQYNLNTVCTEALYTEYTKTMLLCESHTIQLDLRTQCGEGYIRVYKQLTDYTDQNGQCPPVPCTLAFLQPWQGTTWWVLTRVSWSSRSERLLSHQQTMMVAPDQPEYSSWSMIVCRVRVVL